jgi:copper transport protein
VAAVAAVLALPASAWGHAALLRASPVASTLSSESPPQVTLTFTEPVEPRFATISVTDPAGAQQEAGASRHAPGRDDVLETPLRRLEQGWYLVYWRVISADGHPVRGAFTFAVGPTPGPAPEFAVPAVSETAATPGLVTLRWLMFLAAMSAIGLFVLRAIVVRPVVARVPGTRLRAVSIAFWAALAVALVATPVYAVAATAQFAQRSVFDIGSVLPLLDVSQFGRSFLAFEWALLLFAFAAAVALWLDMPQREQRSVAALLALAGALRAAGAALVAPGAGGHAAQADPRGLAMVVDWAHLAAGSIWTGGLVGLLLLWRSVPADRRIAALAVCVPRFSNIALGSVLVLVATGTVSAVIELPTLASLSESGYGQMLLAKIALLLGALSLAAMNLTRARPRLRPAASRPESATAALLLRRMASGEVVLLAGAVLAASVLTSLAPPASALADIGTPHAKAGPGPVREAVEREGYRFDVRVDPNRAAVPNAFAVRVTRSGRPVDGARLTATLTMLEMEMGSQEYALTGTGDGRYRLAAPALVMVGRWGLSYRFEPPGRPPVDVIVVDRVSG